LVEEQKRVSRLPDVLQELRKQGRSFHCTIAGDGAAREALANALEASGLARQVTFQGYVPPERLNELYLHHDCLLNVSDYEGFSISVLEAMAAGCVPACTDLPGREVATLIDGDTCLLTAMDDLPALGRKLAATAPAQLRRMAARARAAVQSFTPAATWDGLVSLAAAARRQRPIEPWTEGAAEKLRLEWDVARGNPWLPHPHPIRRALARLRKMAPSSLRAVAGGHG
jgi:glycosyltransferase involved in cell wall biosynthesis